MKFLQTTILAWTLSGVLGFSGESALTVTYQPLCGLGSGKIKVVAVTCHHWYANSASSPVDLIALKNVPPTDNPKEAIDDLNLASLSGLKFATNDLGAVGSDPMILIDASELKDTEPRGYPIEEVVRASLECLRRCLPEQLTDAPVTLKCKKADEAWLKKLVDEFNSHPRDEVFF